MSLFCTDGGQVLYGIKPNCPDEGRATVQGMVCNQETRDRFRLSLSKLVTQHITPPVGSNAVRTQFLPVIDREQNEPIDDLFVVGMCAVKIVTLFTQQ